MEKKIKRKYLAFKIACLLLNILVLIVYCGKMIFYIFYKYVEFLTALAVLALILWLFEYPEIKHVIDTWFTYSIKEKITISAHLFLVIYLTLLVFNVSFTSKVRFYKPSLYVVWQKQDSFKIIKKDEMAMYDGKITAFVDKMYRNYEILDDEYALKDEEFIYVYDKATSDVKMSIPYCDVIMVQFKVDPPLINSK